MLSPSRQEGLHHTIICTNLSHAILLRRRGTSSFPLLACLCTKFHWVQLISRKMLKTGVCDKVTGKKRDDVERKAFIGSTKWCL